MQAQQFGALLVLLGLSLIGSIMLHCLVIRRDLKREDALHEPRFHPKRVLHELKLYHELRAYHGLSPTLYYVALLLWGFTIVLTAILAFGWLWTRTHPPA
jgi:hypothetical protein